MICRSELETLALRLWLEGKCYFEIVDELIERVTMTAPIDGFALHEDFETEARRHQAILNGEIE